jgi:hypothetical protein
MEMLLRLSRPEGLRLELYDKDNNVNNNDDDNDVDGNDFSSKENPSSNAKICPNVPI